MAEVTPQEQLQQTFDRIWGEIRGARLYAGQPRNEASAQSVSLARQALELATDSGSSHFLVEAWRMLAYSLTANEQYEDAIPYYENSIAAMEEAGKFEQAARSRIGYVAALFHVGRYRDALQAALPAEEWFQKNKDENRFARLCSNIANLHHRLDEPLEAIRYSLLAVEIFSKLGDVQALAQAYMNTGNALTSADRLEQADEMYEKAENLSRQEELTALWAQSAYNRAYLRFLRGRYSEALQAFGRLRERFERAESRHVALCDLDEAQIYIQLHLAKEAETLAVRASQRFAALGEKYEEAKATALEGVALMQVRRYAEALDVFRTAQRLFEVEGNLYWIGLLDLYRAEVHFSLQRLWEAQALATQAKGIFEQLATPSKRISSLVLLARVALALNDLCAAETATEEISSLIQTTRIPLVLFPYHLLCAEIAERTRDRDDAQHHYELAAQELERHQARLHHDDLRVTFFRGRHQAYDALVRLSLEHPDPKEGLRLAYDWCERARSRGLVELLSHYSPSMHNQDDQSLLVKINRLREELNFYYSRAQPELRPLVVQSNYELISLKEQELARTLRQVSALDPEYASLHQVSIATMESVREALPERTTLLEYFTTGDEILAFIISRSGAQVVRRLCPGGRILNLQERLGFQIEKFLLGRDYVQAHAEQILESTRRRLQELYSHLIAPFVDQIQTPHLAIVPHGTLHFLPFHAFFDGSRYLIDRFEISYAPSASVLKYCFEKPEVPGNAPLLVGVADEKAPLVDQELAKISRLFPNARVLRGEDATRTAFVESSKGSSFIHIATHAVFRQDNPMFSSFKLADGYFTAFDLFSLSCPTNLVTLSGCQSGMSEVTGSDDLLGLMRGFLYAGARSLLVSLWNVNDESTAMLMVNFYREWEKGTAKSTAFRKAMLSVREEYPNPFYWAPFLLAGNP